MVVKVKKIGNSVGVLLPKAFVKQYSISDEVSLEVRGDTIVISPVTAQPRQGWEAQFLKAGSLKDNEMLLDGFGNSFDKKEWTW